jgi:hypothetical protein
MAVFQRDYKVTLTSTWALIVPANAAREFLHIQPVTTFYDAYWSSDASLAGGSVAAGFPVLAGEDFQYAEGAAPKGDVYMRSANGEMVNIREGA